MIRCLPLTSSAIILLALAACGEAMITGTIHRAGAPHHFATSGGRDLKTVIVGNPFTQPKQQVDAAIVDAMQGHHSGPRTNLTTAPGPSAIPVYRIAIMFDPPRTVGSAALCGDTGALSPHPSGGIRLLAAFCADDLPITSVDAIMPSRGKRADDPAMRRFMASVMRELIPAEDPLAFID